MYLVSPFYGINDYAMLFGNIALVIAAVLVHLSCVIVGRAALKQHRSLLQNLARFRFPNFSIQAAVYAVQGVAIGGWGLLWDIINPDDDSPINGGDIVAKLLCWITSLVYPFLAVGVIWRIRLSLLRGDGVIIERLIGWLRCIQREGALDSRRDIEAGASLPTDGNAFNLSARNTLSAFLPASKLLERLAPFTFWQPRQVRLMFGAAFVSIKPTVLMHPQQSYWWLVGDVLWLPVIVSVASTTKPSAAARSVACNSVMIVVAILLLIYAVSLAYFRPYRVGARNLLSPIVTLLMAVTCLLASPLLTDRMTSSEIAKLAVQFQHCRVLQCYFSQLLIWWCWLPSIDKW